jgi:hypothetical protein
MFSKTRTFSLQELAYLHKDAFAQDLLVMQDELCRVALGQPIGPFDSSHAFKVRTYLSFDLDDAGMVKGVILHGLCDNVKQ